MSLPSKTFCVYPWVYQMVTSMGEAGFCCVAAPPAIPDGKGRPISLRHGGFRAAWNCAALRSIRERMSRGESVEACEVCYFQERLGKRSHRQHHNVDWELQLGAAEIERRVEEGAARGHALESAPAFLHLCLGSVCNLKCRMCGPDNSSLIREEWRILRARTGRGDLFPEGGGEEGAWYDGEDFWRDCEAAIPHLRKVYLTGGEPTLIKGNERFLRRCVELGRAREIELLFNVNCTRVSDAFLELIGRFRAATVCASLDAVGAAASYIRHPCRWEEVRANFARLVKGAGPEVRVAVTPVAQAYNALDLVPLFDFIEGLEADSGRPIDVYVLDCLNPRHLSLAVLPRRARDEAVRRLSAFKARSAAFRPDAGRRGRHLRDGVDGLIRQLSEAPPGDAGRLLELFRDYTRVLDEQRGEDFKAVFPDLAALLACQPPPGP